MSFNLGFNRLQKENGQMSSFTRNLFRRAVVSILATLDFPSIAAAASADLTIAVPSAVVNDTVSLGLPTAPTAGIIFQTFVSAANVVTIRATNITASPVDPASAVYEVTLVRS